MAKTNVRMRLFVNLEGAGATAYRDVRAVPANTKDVQTAIEYLYAGLHGWSPANKATYTALEAPGHPFYPEVNLDSGTDMVNWADCVAHVNYAIGAYNSCAFGLEFDYVNANGEPRSVRWIRKEGKIVIEYSWDLRVKNSERSATAWNYLPIVSGDPVPRELEVIEANNMTCNYRIKARYNWNAP